MEQQNFVSTSLQVNLREMLFEIGNSGHHVVDPWALVACHKRLQNLLVVTWTPRSGHQDPDAETLNTKTLNS